MTVGYSGTSLPHKLGISADSRVLVLGQPSGTDLGAWDCATRHTRAGKGRYDVCAVDDIWSGLAFVRRLRDR